MAEHVLNARQTQKNDTKVNWRLENPVLLKGEIGIEIDTLKQKTGDGITEWNDLDYATVTPEDINHLDTDAMLRSEFAVNGEPGVVDRAVNAGKLTTPRNITIEGDIVASGAFDGSQNLTLAAALHDLVAAGKYVKVTVSSKGLVTGFDVLAPSDIPLLTLAHITDAGTAASRDVGSAPGSVVIVEANGFINNALINTVNIVNVYASDTVEEMLEMEVEPGDMVIANLASGAEVYIFVGPTSTDINDWMRLNLPVGVTLVNGMTGVVTLTTTNINEGTNMYFTETRATANFQTNFALAESSGLADGANLLRATDFFILDGGNATLA